jgi:four helix bundle protein
LPLEEKYGVTSQMKRSALSIASNIAEVQGRDRSVDFGRFLRVANGSRHELETQILLAVRLGMLEESTTEPALGLIGEIGRFIRGLMRTLPSN